MIVSATAHSDDRVFEVSFDAAPFLAQATDKSILELVRCGWGGDEPADRVAEYFQGKNPEIDAMFAHLNSIRDLRSHKDMCGFECHVDPEMAEDWVKANRAHLVELGNSPRMPGPR